VNILPGNIHLVVQYKEAILAYAILLKEEKGEVISLSSCVIFRHLHMFTQSSWSDLVDGRMNALRLQVRCGKSVGDKCERFLYEVLKVKVSG